MGNLSSYISLAFAFATQKRAPPGSWEGDLLQVAGPEQPLAPVWEAHIYDYVLFPPVATHHLADQTSARLYPVVAGHPHSHAHACVLRLHD